jgi:hypothetical protein
MPIEWNVRFSNTAGKQYEKLKRSGQKKCSVNDLIDLLVLEIQQQGPERKNWPNYGKLSKNSYHCHLKKGRPTYVACWMVIDEKKRQVYRECFKNRNMARRRPEFETGEAGVEAAQLQEVGRCRQFQIQ